jgi:hypothetical protein
MKNYILLYFLLFSINVFSQNETAQQYYDFIQQEEIATGTELLELGRMLKDGDSKEIEQQLQVFRNTVNSALEKIDDTDAFQKNKYLKEDALDYFEVLKHVGKNDFRILVELIIKENLTAEDKEKALGYYSKISHHIDDADKKLKESKKKFAEKYQLKAQQTPFKFYLEETKH